MKSLLLVDDHRLLLDASAQVLRCHLPGSEIAVATTCREGLALASQQRFDLAVIDLELPDRSGLEMVTELKLMQPELPTIVLSMHTNFAWVKRMLQEGVRGYVSKSSGSDELVLAIKSVARGEVYLSKDITLQFVNLLANKEIESLIHEKLTKRELEVLIQLAQNKDLKQIASDLGLSPKTVSVHKFNIFQKTNLGTTQQIRKYCQHAGLISMEYSVPA